MQIEPGSPELMLKVGMCHRVVGPQGMVGTWCEPRTYNQPLGTWHSLPSWWVVTQLKSKVCLSKFLKGSQEADSEQRCSQCPERKENVETLPPHP